MLSAMNRAVGGNFNFPDVCNTPVGPATVPIPYPNFSFNFQAFPFCLIVRVSYVNALNMGSSKPMSTGDEGGVAHPMYKGSARYLMGCVKVFFEKLPASQLTSPTASNNMNAPLGAALIPSITNVFLTDAARHGVLGESDDWRAVGLASDAVASLERPRSEAQIRRDGDVVIVTLATIDSTSPSRLARALSEARETEAVGLVLDLRNNPGGELDAARRLAEELLPRRAPIVILREPDGDVTTLRSRHEGATDMPLWVLVDETTASAAEVLAACLQHNRRGRVIGRRSYGKGRVQCAKLTASGPAYGDAFACELPAGSPIEGRGVTPDRVCDDALEVALAEAVGSATTVRR